MMTTVVAMDLQYGQRTLPGTIEYLAQVSPEAVWARYVSSTRTFEQGQFESVTFSDLANAINRLASHLLKTVPRHERGETLCYIGPSDIRYFMLACAACKAEYTVLFSSPRNNEPAHESLLKATNCGIILYAAEIGLNSVLEHLARAQGLATQDIPSLDKLLDSNRVEYIAWDKSLKDVAHEPFVILHTSGSTGMPKPVKVTHGLIATIDAQQELPDVNGRHVTARCWANRAVYTALPPFHSAGINFFSFSIFQSTELVFGPPDSPPTLSTIETMLNMHIADAAVLPPSLLEEIARDDDMLQKVEQWSSVTYGGGPLSQSGGDALWEHTKVLHILGSTETFNLPELEPRCKDEWRYHSYHPALNVEFRDTAGEHKELVFLRSPEVVQHQGAFWTFPELFEYPMHDLYEEHPTKADLWQYRGRVDDLIVLSNGEKFNPTAAEQIFATNPTIKSALIVGTAKEQPAVLLEPVAELRPSTERKLTDTLAKANQILPAHAQVHASHVHVLDPADTFLRSSKGEIRRGPTISELADTIADLYESADRNLSISSTIDTSNHDTLCSSLSQLISSQFLDGHPVNNNDNLFQSGFDSLMVLKLARSFNAAMRQQGTGMSISSRFIYQHPTVSAIAEALPQSAECRSHQNGTNNDTIEMQHLSERLTTRIEALRSSKRTQRHTTTTVILLTGSTGSLGSYILESLSRSTRVKKIVCLNRSQSAIDRQIQANKSRGLCTDFSRVQFLQTDITATRLGLSECEYTTLSEEMTHIIHNAWSVDFNLPLSSFEPQLQACCNLVELAVGAKHHVTTTFMSSIGAANNWSRYHSGTVPETALNDLRVAEPMGYARSKHIAELIFDHANQTLDQRISICRIGQIAGPVVYRQGAWNPKEWFPSILSSCEKLQVLPENLAAMNCMDWIPVDLLADMLVETVLVSTHESLQESDFLHFVNPHRVYWHDFVHALINRQDSTTQVVPYHEWLGRVAEAAGDGNMDDIPATKLLAFFEDIANIKERPEFSTVRSRAKSQGLNNLKPVSADWLKCWIGQMAAAL